MTFDNSWEIMTEDEMYDVNGGFWRWRATTFINNISGWMESSVAVKRAMLLSGITLGTIAKMGSIGFTFAVAKFGTPVIIAATVATGPIGFAIAGLGITAAIWVLGTVRFY